jgi:hypothetical protein
MEVVHLPILPATTPLKDAVRAMRIQQRSAVIREEPTKLELIKIPKIFIALGHQLTSLVNVNVSDPVYRPTPGEISSRNLDTKNPRNSWADWQSLFQAVSDDYILVDSYLGTALIVTRHEGKAGEIKVSPKDCYCSGPHEHSFPPPSVAKGKKCPRCAGIVHCE